jgi:hypothetical protein
MFKRKKTSLAQTIQQYCHPAVSELVLLRKFIFQQDIVDDLTASQNRRIPTEDSIDLSSTVCAGICYWSAISILGLEKRSITDFIEQIYSPEKGIKHTLGVSHVDFVKQLAKEHPSLYGLTLNPFREQSPKMFKDYGGYAGKKTELFFEKNYRKIKDTSSALIAILEEGGLGIVSIQSTFNSYSANFHDVLVLGFNSNTKSFLVFDPDARSHYDPQKTRPTELIPLKKKPGMYIIHADYVDKHTYRQKPSPGGITIGLFTS